MNIPKKFSFMLDDDNTVFYADFVEEDGGYDIVWHDAKGRNCIQYAKKSVEYFLNEDIWKIVQ